jgi:hypothetical protein
MRKSIIAGLTLCAAMGIFAGYAQAEDRDARPPKAVHHARKQQPKPLVEGHSMRIPEHPIIRDCVHVFFPQCSPRPGL